MIDNKTANLLLPLPNAANNLSDDVLRLISALVLLDSAVVARPTVAAMNTAISNAIAGLINSAPGALDTLNELASALGNDPNFATTITNSLAAKLSLSGGTMTGNITFSTNQTYSLTGSGGVSIIERATSSGGIRLKSTNGANVVTYVDFDAPDITSADFTYRFGRATATTGAGRLQVFKHDGTANVVHQIASNGDSFFGAGGGRNIFGSQNSYAHYLPGASGNYTPGLQGVGTSFSYAGGAAVMGLSQWSTSTTVSGGAAISLNKSNGDAAGTHVAVVANQRLGAVGFAGSDGAKFCGAADIAANVDGTPTSGVVPGRLVFLTSGSADATPVERMRITSAGNVGIGTSTPDARLDVAGSAAFDSLVVRSPLPNLARVITSLSSSFSLNTSLSDTLIVTAQTVNTTISADAATPADGQKLTIRVKDNGTARSITFTGGVANGFRPVGVTLTASGSNWSYTTTAGKTVYFGCVYNANAALWDIVAISQEA